MPKTLAAADGSFAAIQVPLAGEKANAQTNGSGAGLEELTIKPITDRLIDARTRLADAEVDVAAHRTAILALASYTPGMLSTERKRFIVPWEHHELGLSFDGSITANPLVTVIATTPLRLVGGVNLRKVGTYMKGNGFTELPTYKPSVELCRMSAAGVFEVLATSTDTCPNTTAFNSYHTNEVGSLSIQTDDEYAYFLRLMNGGTGSGGTGYSYLFAYWETD